MEEEEISTKDNKNQKIVFAIVILLAIAVAAIFILPEFNLPSVPFLSSESTQVLVIGQLSLGERIVLDNLNQEFVYRERTAKDLESSSIEELSDYGIIIIDQTLADKSISSNLGSAINTYVKKSGKLI